MQVHFAGGDGSDNMPRLARSRSNMVRLVRRGGNKMVRLLRRSNNNKDDDDTIRLVRRAGMLRLVRGGPNKMVRLVRRGGDQLVRLMRNDNAMMNNLKRDTSMSNRYMNLRQL